MFNFLKPDVYEGKCLFPAALDGDGDDEFTITLILKSKGTYRYTTIQHPLGRNYDDKVARFLKSKDMYASHIVPWLEGGPFPISCRDTVELEEKDLDELKVIKNALDNDDPNTKSLWKQTLVAAKLCS